MVKGRYANMESRVQKYSRKNRLKRRMKRNLKTLSKNIIMSIFYIAVALIYTLIINTISNIMVVCNSRNIDLLDTLSINTIHINSKPVNFNVEGGKVL